MCRRTHMVENQRPDKSYLRGVNKILKRVGHPLDGSSHILKRLEPNDKYYAVCDLLMGYHQLALHEDSKDLFSIVLPQGKFRYGCMPQGAGPSSDLFNIHTDPQLRGTKGVYKNVDDILTAAPTPGQLEQKMEQVLKVCRKRNMMLSPSKFQCSRQVTFGGVNIKALRQRGDTETRVYLTAEDEKI